MGKLTNHLISQRSQGRLAKPSLHISFNSYPEIDDSKYLKEDQKRCQQELKGLQNELKNWNPEAVAAQALKSLKKEIAIKKARVEELRVRLEGSKDVEEPEMEDEEDDEAEEDEE